ncbi:MAG: HisA/HisF-related TIM barrel protein [Candidatus Methylomirabilaceae bacterium]
MKIIPVIDIWRGVAVHARRGERTQYRPIESHLVPGADPVALLRAYRTSLGSRSIYIADLDAISGHGDNLDVIAEITTSEPGVELLVDVGIRTIDDGRALLRSGASKVIVASESLASLDEASWPLAELGAGRAVFSIDLRDRRVVWRAGSTESTDPYELAARLPPLGFLDAILLEMEKIGTGSGADATFVGRMTRAASGVQFIIGGGIRTVEEILQLKRAGASGVLLATALHDGTITRGDLARLGPAR